ncbi:MAG: polysulfide reductase NrfD [Chlorobi bacterium]|nr:polysulfide reductase NrfD [Chlorobiota bacterium]
MWWLLFGFASSGTLILLGSLGWLVWEGTGVWGLNNPVGWGWAIVNFVFWVGIGHAGTLISAILFLLRQKWRTSINRFAEAMTIVAVICAGIFPGFHVGRFWVAYYLAPVPNQMGVWPNFRSPLLWDVFAVGTYFTVSLMFWYVGMVPDLATLRDRAKTKIRRLVFGFLSLGWRGGNRQWQHYELAYLLLAGLATPLVLSVHSVVSTDFATSLLPGWHTTIFPPYFVAGAIFSGFGMVLTLTLIARKVYGLENIITIDHLEKMNKIILVTGSMVGYAYIMEFFISWYSGNIYEVFTFVNRAFGNYAWAYWIMMICNVITPQFFWFKKVRRSVPIMFVLSIFVNIGMWFERFVITVTSLSRDFLPSSWDYYAPTLWDILTFVGSFGLFFTLFLLFLRFLPAIAMSEVKGVLPQADPHHPDGHPQPEGAVVEGRVS